MSLGTVSNVLTGEPNVAIQAGLIAFVIVVGTISANVAFGQFGMVPFLPTDEKALPTYVVRVNCRFIK